MYRREAVLFAGLFGLLSLAPGCATTARKPTGYGPALARAKESCGRLEKAKATLHAPIQTRIGERLKTIERVGEAGDGSAAFAQADQLAVDCSRETRTRKELAKQVADIEQDRAHHPQDAVLHYYRLVSNGDYSNAMLCGEAMIQGNPERCAYLAVATTPARPEEESLDTPTTPTTAPEPDGDTAPVRGNRMTFSVGFGLGTASLSGVHESANDVEVAFAASNPSTLDEGPTSGMQINWSAELRYYAPYHLMAQLGFGTIYNWATSEFTGTNPGTLKNENWGLELPLLVGAYVMVDDHLCLQGALGPAFLLWSRSLWSSEPGGAPDYKSDPAVGAHFVLGLDYVFNDRWAMGLDMRYRLLKGGELKDVTNDQTLLSGQLRLDASEGKYEMDLSGFSAGVYMRYFVF